VNDLTLTLAQTQVKVAATENCGAALPPHRGLGRRIPRATSVSGRAAVLACM
jgi:hypothetical protein